MAKTIKAKARVKVITDIGYWCLAEIRGLKEGTELEGRYNPVNNAFDFSWQGQDAMLWIGQNGELIEIQEPNPAVVEWQGYTIWVLVVLLNSNGDVVEEFETLKEAKAYIKENKATHLKIAYTAAEEINNNHDLGTACFGSTRKEALNNLKKALK